MNLKQLTGIFLTLTLTLTLTSCSGRKKVIRSNGIHALQLGDELPAPGTKSLKGISLRDTLIEDGEYQWRAALLEYKKGLVYLEEDFFRSEQLNRIRIETPELRLRNGLRVGMTVEDLRDKAEEWYISPMAKYKLFDFYSRMFPRVHFVIDDPNATEFDKEWEAYKVDTFSADARIVAIVVY